MSEDNRRRVRCDTCRSIIIVAQNDDDGWDELSCLACSWGYMPMTIDASPVRGWARVPEDSRRGIVLDVYNRQRVATAYAPSDDPVDCGGGL